MKRRCLLALVTDAFGGRGGIAQYNRDFLSALAESGTASSIIVVPRRAPEPIAKALPVQQLSPKSSRLSYAVATFFAAAIRSVDVVSSAHIHLAPLAAVIARAARATLIVQLHGIEAWKRPTLLQRAAVESADLILCVSRYTRARVLAWA